MKKFSIPVMIKIYHLKRRNGMNHKSKNQKRIKICPYPANKNKIKLYYKEPQI
jgi:hypothetical protein